MTITALGFAYPDHVLDVLKHRDSRNRFALPVAAEGLCPQCRYAVGELRERGYCVQLDQAWMNGRDVFVFLLTQKGVALCDEEGIDAH
jgi:hypothetical protein